MGQNIERIAADLSKLKSDAIFPNREIHWSLSEYGVNSKHWKNSCSTQTLLGILDRHKPQSCKDRRAIMPGQLNDGRRDARSVVLLDHLVLDLDDVSHEQVGKVLDELDEAGIHFRAHTSYSHLFPVTEVATDEFRSVAEENGYDLVESPELAHEVAQRFFDAEGVAVDENDNTLIAEQSPNGGTSAFLVVAPRQKWRIWLFLDRSYRPAELVKLGFKDEEARGAVWNFVNTKVCEVLDIEADKSGFRITQPFYAPACPEHMLEFAEIRVGTGEYCLSLDALLPASRDDLPKVKPRSKAEKNSKPKQQTPKSSSNRKVVDKNGRKIDLFRWFRLNKQFNIEQLLRDKLPLDRIGGDRSNGTGFHITCPFEGDHSEPGGSGTFVANGDGVKSWNIHCCHNGCLSQDRKGTHYLAELIRQGFVTVDDLENPEYGGVPVGDFRLPVA